MAGILVEYSRFVEVQQRRAAIRAELLARADTPETLNARPFVAERAAGVGPSRADAVRPRGVVDVR
jgi:hypothetical protein